MLFLFLFITNTKSEMVDFSKNSESVLLQSEYFIDNLDRSYNDILDIADFQKSKTAHVNLGFARNKSIWVRLKLYNPTQNIIENILEVKNPLLEKVTFYDKNITYITGMVHKKENDRFINSTYLLSLNPSEIRTIYIHIENQTTALRFGICIKDKNKFLEDEQLQQFLIVIFFGILITLLVYNISLYIYIRDEAFLYYCIYLIALIFHQSTYLGMSPIFFSSWLTELDNIAVLYKVNAMYIAASFFAKSFLKTKKHPLINKIYNLIIIIAFIEMPLFGTQSFYYPEVGILTGFIFVVFNVSAGIYVYKKGYKQARFFVFSWSILVIGFIIIIYDALGIINLMYKYPNIVMYSTAMEALVLSLAFTDSYTILKNEKNKADSLLLQTMHNYQSDLEAEIGKKTKSLNEALENERSLRDELHHRTKNNLQLILSIVRMQSDENITRDTTSTLKRLENRIESIAKVHQFLSIKKNLERIGMCDYIEELCTDLEDSFSNDRFTFKVSTQNISLPIQEASYIGLLLNELITNSIKYSKRHELNIVIELSKKLNEYRLIYRDNGIGFRLGDNENKSLGTIIIDTLVKRQLDGEMEIGFKHGIYYDIRFSLDEKSIDCRG